MGRPADYHRADVAEKQRQQRDAIREPQIACPWCEVKTTVTDLLTHIAERCPGQREVHPLSKWISKAEALELGVTTKTLQRWTELKWVRTRGRGKARRYLERDLVSAIAIRSRPKLRLTAARKGGSRRGS